VLAANLLGALGGCWWPIEVVPEFLQRLAWCLPTGWAMYGMHRLMNFGAGWSEIALPFALLGGSALVFFYLAQRTFRYQ
jgi:ABC-type multidrug transport system permease subunit